MLLLQSIAGMFSYIWIYILPFMHVIVSIGCKLTLFSIFDCDSLVLFLVGEFIQYNMFLFIHKVLGGLFLPETIPSPS